MKINSKIIELIQESKNVAIFTHLRPDADAIGSACALKMVLEKMGKNADVMCDTDIISPNFAFIKNSNKVNRPMLMEYDTAIAVDCGDLGRLGKYDILFNSIPTTINIDHHVTNDNFAQNNFVREASSTGEILYFVFKTLKVNLNKDIAMALYAAISSDTGCFLHNNVTPDSHKIAGYLMKYKIDIGKANYYLFKRRSLGQIKLQQIALHNLKFYLDNRVAIMYLTAKDFKLCDIGTNESFGLVDIGINIEKVEVGILISEIKPNLYACSIRGKGNVDTSLIAKTFGGGGHVNASGCNIFGTCNTVINKLVRVSKKFLC